MSTLQAHAFPAVEAATPTCHFGRDADLHALRVEAEWYVQRASVMMDRARALVEHDRVDGITLLTARRAALASHFQRYQRFKHARIFDPVVQFGPASSRVVASRMKVDCLQLGATFGAYHGRWMRLTVADWSTYRQDMLYTVDELQRNITGELRAIRQLLTISEFYGG